MVSILPRSKYSGLVRVIHGFGSHCFLKLDAALGFADLEIKPHKLKGYPTEFLVCYRKGGPSFGSTVSEKMGSADVAPRF